MRKRDFPVERGRLVGEIAFLERGNDARRKCRCSTVEKRMENAEREEKVVGSRHGWPRITARLPASSSGIVGPVSS